MKKLLFALSLLGLTAFAAAPSANADDHHGFYRDHGYRHDGYGHRHGGHYGHPRDRHRYRHYRWSHGRRVYYYSYGPYGYYDEPGYYGPAYYNPGVNFRIGL